MYMHESQQKLQSSQVPLSKILLTNWLYKNEFITQPHNYCQIPICIPACMMSSEYFTITYLCLIKLLIFESSKTLLWRHLHQIWGNRASRNFITASRVYSRMQEIIKNLQLYNYQQIQLLNNTVFIWLTVVAF